MNGSIFNQSPGFDPLNNEVALMEAALAASDGIARLVSPNPGVGAAIGTTDGCLAVGVTQTPPGAHAEVMALLALCEAGASAKGATLAVTLEPCSHFGRTPPCVNAIIESGIARVIVGCEDPDHKVAGRGIAALREAGIEVTVGCLQDRARDLMRAYLLHRTLGRPFVTLKLAASLDSMTAAADGTSKWITGPEARADVHRLRAINDAVLVGAGTARADDPELTVRLVDGPDPLRVVLGKAPTSSKVRPCLELSGALSNVLQDLGERGVLSLLVEGGAMVAGQFLSEGYVDELVLYVAPIIMGGNTGFAAFGRNGVATLSAATRRKFKTIDIFGDDIRIIS